MGPYQSIAPLEPLLDRPVVYAVDGIARRHRAARGESLVDAAGIAARGSAEAFLADVGAGAIVRSTSDDVEVPNLEDVLTEAAAVRAIPVVVVEDFPGNFRTVPAGRLEALCVETETVAALHAERGFERARIHLTGNPRYDVLRAVNRATRRAATRTALGLGAERMTVLWVGQPDGEASYATLETVLPWLGDATLLFRAHPRDAGYADGRYGGLLQGRGTPSVDVTDHPDVVGLCCAADLVITQFSSVAVEAGYLGTPAVFVLLPTLGGAYIRKHKGYAIPPWCKENCAFLLDDAKMAAVVVDTAMHDPKAREMVRMNFTRRYASRPPSAPAVARLITACLER
jgi:hypothetical protein